MWAKDSTKLRPLVLLAFAVGGVVVGIAGWWLFSATKISFYARGLGAVEGKALTNSKEAFAESYKKGFRDFEIDLRLTSDDEVCASADEAPVRTDKKTFLAKKIQDKFEPLCLDGLTEILKTHADALFLLDVNPTKDSAEAFRRIYQKLVRAWSDNPEIWSRVTPQIYQELDLGVLKSYYRFRSVAYNLTRTKSTDDAVVMFVARTPEITSVVMDGPKFSSTVAKEARRAGRGVTVIGVNGAKEIAEFSKKGATAFLTDTHGPNEP